MSAREQLLDNLPFVARSFVELIVTEGDRISSQGLADYTKVKDAISTHLSEALCNVSNDQHAALTTLSDLHNDLVNIKLPRDFEKFADTMQQYKAKKSELEKAKQEVMKELNTPEQQLAKDEPPCECTGDKDCKCGPDCKCRQEEEIVDSLAHTVLKRLERIAYELGKNGHHRAAYAIEKKMRLIKQQNNWV